MGKIITDARGLVAQPKDPYWDGNLTRREMQVAVNQLSENDMALMNMVDTLNIVVNFILEEKLGVKDRQELDAYVARKMEQMKSIQAVQLAQQSKGNAEQQQPSSQEAQTQEPDNGPNLIIREV